MWLVDVSSVSLSLEPKNNNNNLLFKVLRILDTKWS